MVASVVASATNLETSNLSDENIVSKPTGTANGNLLLGSLAIDDGDASFGAPTGFTKDFALSAGGTNSLVTAYKTAGCESFQLRRVCQQ